jgi:hypothetical protein
VTDQPKLAAPFDVADLRRASREDRKSVYVYHLDGLTPDLRFPPTQAGYTSAVLACARLNKLCGYG